MEAGEYWLKRGTCFVSRRPAVVAVAGLLWVSWCLLVAAGFRVFHYFHFQIPAHDLWLRETQSRQRRLGEGATTASQSAHPELAPTDPHQVYQLSCFPLRIMAPVDPYRSSQTQPV